MVVRVVVVVVGVEVAGVVMAAVMEAARLSELLLQRLHPLRMLEQARVRLVHHHAPQVLQPQLAVHRLLALGPRLARKGPRQKVGRAHHHVHALEQVLSSARHGHAHGGRWSRRAPRTWTPLRRRVGRLRAPPRP